MHIERNIVFWSAVLTIFVGLLWLLSPILLPFVLGMAIAYLLDPLNRRLTARHKPGIRLVHHPCRLRARLRAALCF